MKIIYWQNPKIFVKIPLTTQSGKVRVKARNSFYEYGLPVATKQTPFSQRHYIEWQIGYDADKNDSKKLDLTSLKESEFIGANGKRKALYELSEYLFYFVHWDIITLDEVENLKTILSRNDIQYISEIYKIQTKELQPYFRSLNSSVFSLRTINLPYLIWKYPRDLNCQFSIEIIITQQQYGTEIQPMLYVCFPTTHLSPNKNKPALLGRKADLKECANLTLDEKDKAFVLEAFKIFGILSPSHNYDIRRILEWIRANSKGTQCSQNA